MARGPLSMSTEVMLADAVKIRNRTANLLKSTRASVDRLAELEELHASNESVVQALGGQPFDFGTAEEN